jgi:hypothetical protein
MAEGNEMEGMEHDRFAREVGKETLKELDNADTHEMDSEIRKIGTDLSIDPKVEPAIPEKDAYYYDLKGVVLADDLKSDARETIRRGQVAEEMGDCLRKILTMEVGVTFDSTVGDIVGVLNRLRRDKDELFYPENTRNKKDENKQEKTGGEELDFQ